MMDEGIRVSDADRERVAAQLREHYAEGRLSADELDERLSAAFGARTSGDLGRVTADLPGPGPAGPPPPPGGQAAPPWAGGYGYRRRRRHRIVPLLLIALIVALVVPGLGWALAVVIKLVLLLWLVAMVAGLIAAFRFRRRARRFWRSGGWPSAASQWGNWHWGDWPSGGGESRGGPGWRR
jgi:hypothetical protein